MVCGRFVSICRSLQRLQTWLRNSLILCAAIFTFNHQAQASQVILHAFNWHYQEVTAQAEEIAKLGYTHVLIMPAVKSMGGYWWARYQPQDYRTIDHPLGNKEDLEEMIAALGEFKIGVIADVVFNHMANEAWQRPDLNYPGAAVLSDYQKRKAYFERNKLFGDLDDNIFSSFDFHQSGCIRDYFNIVDVQQGRICSSANDPGLPDLVSNAWVIHKQRLYLQSLKDMGIVGFRIDAAKHMTNEHIKAVFTEDIMDGMLVFGEIITYGGSDSVEYRLFLDPYLQETDHMVYDFPLLALLKKTIGGNNRLDALVKPENRGQAIQDQRSIRVATTHDVANSQFDFFTMTPEQETLAYAYLLGKGEGIPLIYSESADPGRERWRDLHKRSDIVAMIDFYHELQGEDVEFLDSSSCTLAFRRGERGLVAINKCPSAQDINVDTAEIFGERSDQMFDIIGNQQRNRLPDGRLQLAPMSAQMWLIPSN